ncbi:hypothetical protein [Pseudomonas soli]|uniref:hypothetical protein n=1 Tax=Pseudomonas soli TaxID=1306993 RepID=UPI0028A6BC10|nr:hypothetical protein [Pseudomonas soli]
MARYFPIFLLGIFMSILPVAMTATLWFDTYWRNPPDNPLYTVMVTGGLVVLLCLGHIAMVRGLNGALWMILPVLAVALLTALSLIGSSLHTVLQLAALVLPLLAMLVFNSQRHREMRRLLAELRKKRC